MTVNIINIDSLTLQTNNASVGDLVVNGDKQQRAVPPVLKKRHYGGAVPILGPLLFLLYINDLSHVSSLLFGLLFADDSNMFMTGQDPNELVRLTNIEITKIQKWLQINKLTPNIKKKHIL